MFSFWKRKGKLKGTISIIDMPVTKMFEVSVSLFRVPDATSDLPYEGKPPGRAYKDETWIKGREDPDNFPLKFSLTKPLGFYFVDVGVIAYREVEGEMYAQVEHFFPNNKPIQIVQNEETFNHVPSSFSF